MCYIVKSCQKKEKVLSTYQTSSRKKAEREALVNITLKTLKLEISTSKLPEISFRYLKRREIGSRVF